MLDRRRLAAYHALSVGPAWRARGGQAPAPDSPASGWDALEARVEACRDCSLGSVRRQSVFGTGSRSARWLLVGEAPGAEEDRVGEPFVGRAGALLDAILQASGLDRKRDVYIANVLKCRPPGNRDPGPDEVMRCEPHLSAQIALLRPALIVLMGRFAAQTLLGAEASIASLRGRLHTIDIAGSAIAAIVTYHPAYLLRNPADKRLAWSDWCLARREMQRLTCSVGNPGNP